MDRVLLTPEEVAEALHIGRCTVYRFVDVWGRDTGGYLDE